MPTYAASEGPNGIRGIRLPFVQYMMPEGRPQHLHLDALDPDGKTAKAAEALQARGLVFEAEMLRNYATISFTVTDPEEGDVDCELVVNGPEVPGAIRTLILRAAALVDGQLALPF